MEYLETRAKAAGRRLDTGALLLPWLRIANLDFS